MSGGKPPPTPKAPCRAPVSKSHLPQNTEQFVCLSVYLSIYARFTSLKLTCASMSEEGQPGDRDRGGAEVGAEKVQSFHGRRHAPDEVLTESDDKEYLALRAQTDWREPHRQAHGRRCRHRRSLHPPDCDAAGDPAGYPPSTFPAPSQWPLQPPPTPRCWSSSMLRAAATSVPAWRPSSTVPWATAKWCAGARIPAPVTVSTGHK